MSEENTKKDLFETMPVPQAVARMCIPSIIGSLVMMLYSMADTYFVGALNSSIESSAVTLASPVLLAFNAVNNLFGVGTGSYMSRCLGVRDHDTTRRASAFGIYWALISGFVFSGVFLAFRPFFLKLLGATADTYAVTSEYIFWTVICGAVPSILNVVLGYLIRAEGAAMHATIGTMSGCILNVILDPFFILPRFLGMGAAGAGLATFISNSVAVLYFLILIAVKKEKTFVSFKWKDFAAQKGIAKPVFNVGVPAAIQNLLNVTGQTVLNNFASAYGPAVVSAVGISHKIIMVPLMMAIGVSNGITPLISYNYSSGDRKRMKDVFRFTLKISMGIAVVMALGTFIFPGKLMTFFIKDADIVSYGEVFLRIASVTIPCMAMDFIAVGVFQACGMGRKSLIFAVLRKIVLEIPALFIWNRIFPINGLAAAQPTSEFILAIAAIVVLRKIFKDVPRGQDA